ncbi:MAG TPA: DUF6779 domain-containing protein [Actinokineospora sp.]|nr:DUF6779 domain-containing protein [Actinokineospora sp.]
MKGRTDATTTGSLGARAMLLVAVGLAMTATAVLVLSESVRWMRLGVVAALWAALAGAFLAARYRKQVADRAEDAAALQKVYELELEREITARREFELEVEAEAKAAAESEARDDLAELRAELRAMREHLEMLLSGGEVLVERVALRAEATRMRAVADNDKRAIPSTPLRRIAAAKTGEADTEMIERIRVEAKAGPVRRADFTPHPSEMSDRWFIEGTSGQRIDPNWTPSWETGEQPAIRDITTAKRPSNGAGSVNGAGTRNGAGSVNGAGTRNGAANGAGARNGAAGTGNGAGSGNGAGNGSRPGNGTRISAGEAVGDGHAGSVRPPVVARPAAEPPTRAAQAQPAAASVPRHDPVRVNGTRDDSLGRRAEAQTPAASAGGVRVPAELPVRPAPEPKTSQNLVPVRPPEQPVAEGGRRRAPTGIFPPVAAAAAAEGRRAAAAHAEASGYHQPVARPTPAETSGHGAAVGREAEAASPRRPAASAEGYQQPAARPVSAEATGHGLPVSQEPDVRRRAAHAEASGYHQPVARSAEAVPVSPDPEARRRAAHAEASGYHQPVARSAEAVPVSPEPEARRRAAHAEPSGYHQPVARPTPAETTGHGSRPLPTHDATSSRPPAAHDSGARQPAHDAAGSRSQSGHDPGSRPQAAHRAPTGYHAPVQPVAGRRAKPDEDTGGRRRRAEEIHEPEPAGSHTEGKSVRELLAAHGAAPTRRRRRRDED